MPWHLAAAGHHQQWYCLCRIHVSLYSMSKGLRRERIEKYQYICVFLNRNSTYNKLIHLSSLIAPDPLLIQWPCPLVEKGDNSTTHVNHQGWTLATDVSLQSGLRINRLFVRIYHLLHLNFTCNFIYYICCMHILYIYIFWNMPFWFCADLIFEKLSVFVVVCMGHQINSLRLSDAYMQQ